MNHTLGPRPLKTQGNPAEEHLRRVIGPWGLALTAVNIAIGAGIFIQPGVLAGMLGPAAVLAHLVCGIVTGLVMACFIDLSSEVTRTGGPLAALQEVLGVWPGYICWVLYGLYLLAAVAFLSLAFSDSVGLQGIARPGVAAVLIAFIGIVNLIGVQYGLRFAVVTTVAKLAALAVVVLGGAFAMSRANLTIPSWPASDALGAASIAMFFAFAGTEAAMLPAGELRNSRTTVPRGIFTAVAALFVIYASVQWVSQGVLGAGLRGSSAPLANVAAAALGPSGSVIVRIGTTISILGSLSGGLLAFPRWAFLGARTGVLPDVIGQVHSRFRTPGNAILATCAVSILVALSGALQFFGALTSASILGVYFAVCVAVWRRPRNPNQFGLPGAKAIAVIAGVSVLWLLVHLSGREFAAVGLTLAAGILYRAITSRRKTLSLSE
jgi:amino acid transporter